VLSIPKNPVSHTKDNRVSALLMLETHRFCTLGLRVKKLSSTMQFCTLVSHDPLVSLTSDLDLREDMVS
jgi:hypothetical protein